MSPRATSSVVSSVGFLIALCCIAASMSSRVAEISARHQHNWTVSIGSLDLGIVSSSRTITGIHYGFGEIAVELNIFTVAAIFVSLLLFVLLVFSFASYFFRRNHDAA
jgi:hypothetical protein